MGIGLVPLHQCLWSPPEQCGKDALDPAQQPKSHHSKCGPWNKICIPPEDSLLEIKTLKLHPDLRYQNLYFNKIPR